MSATVRYETVYLTWGRRSRRPRGANGAFQEVPNNPPVPPPGDMIVLGEGSLVPPGPLGSQMPSELGPGNEFKFSFLNITGVAGGPLFSTEPVMPQAFVGSDPAIVVLAVYMATGGIPHPPGEPGVSVDAFDISTNELLEDLFVSVAGKGDRTSIDATLTDSANDEGWVSTEAEGVVVTADQQIGDGSAAEPACTFRDWMVVWGPDGVVLAGPDKAELEVEEGDSVYALAAYATTVQEEPPIRIKWGPPNKLWPGVEILEHGKWLRSPGDAPETGSGHGGSGSETGLPRLP